MRDTRIAGSLKGQKLWGTTGIADSCLKQTLFQEAMGSRNSPDIVEETQEHDYRLGKITELKA